jgi:uncharacterized protein (DUF2267 family)
MQLHHTKQQTPIAQTIAEMDEQTVAVFSGCGSRFASNKAERIAIATDYARQLGDNPTFAEWEAARIAFVDGYSRANPDNTGNAADAEFSRFARLLDELFGMKKPKSTSEAAEKKAAERKAANDKLLAEHADSSAEDISDQLRAAYETLAKKPTDSAAKKTTKNLEKVLKAKMSEENKEHGETLKTLRAQVIEAVRKCTSTETLEAIIDTLEDGSAD